jgi:prepilin-type N-terminal cleavage/methylation domain-containing protein
MPGTLARRDLRAHQHAFTLVEMLVSIAVLTLFVLIMAQLLNSEATITTVGNKRMDADTQGRSVLDRMAVDFGQMVKRSDVDYYLKSSQTAVPDCTTCTPQTGGNDQIAFFSSVSGYYPTPSYQSPVSLVAYRVNSGQTNSSYNKLERMGKGLIWNGVSSSYMPILFLDSATAPTTTIANKWPAAVSTSISDVDYEVAGPQVFRFEYYYLLTDGTFAIKPWLTGHSNVAGLRDVAAIVADIAVIDPKSKVLLTDAQIARLNGAGGQAPVLVGYSAGMTAGQLLTQWRAALDANTIGLSRPAVSGIRLYERYFYLNGQTQ